MSAVYARCIRRFLYTLSRVEISVYAVYPDTCGRSYPHIFVYADVTVSEPVFFRARFSKMAASRNVVCSMLLGLHRPSKQMSCLRFFSVFLLIETFFMVFFNRNFFRSSSSHVLKPQVNKHESREFGAKIIAGSAFFVMRMLC